MAEDSAVALVRDAFFLRANGERPPGAPSSPAAETWKDWENRALAFLNQVPPPGSPEDELARLRWVEMQLAAMAQDLHDHADEASGTADQVLHDTASQIEDILAASAAPGGVPLAVLSLHELARRQIAKHGRDRYPSVTSQMLKFVAETGELASEIQKGGFAAPSPALRREYADVGLSLAELGNKLGLDLAGCMAVVVENDERDFREGE
jgi:NTP pyrophosphatase (non-canonical NTP hydrolase)